MKCCNFPPMNKAGYPVIAASVIIGLALSLFMHSIAFDILALFLNVGVCYFFRDPLRLVPKDSNLIVSPADGRVTLIKRGVKPPVELGMEEDEMIQVSIYMNVMNVHVNRMPVSSTVKNSVYTAGIFKNLHFDTHDDNSESYERQALALQDERGNGFVVVQIAGYVARRIVSVVNVGESVSKGSRIGMICFGSRVDFYMPNFVSLQIAVGQTLVAGETIVALYNEGECVEFDII